MPAKSASGIKKGVIYALLAATLWGSSGVCAQYIMQHSELTASRLTMFRMLFAGIILLMLSFMHGDRVFKIFTVRRDIWRLLIFSVFGTLGIQLTFLITIEKSNAATATVLQFLSPTIIVCWFALVLRKRSGKSVIATVIASLAGTFLLVTHGNPTTLTISGGALFWGIISAFGAAFFTTYPSRLIIRYGTLPVVGGSMLIAGLLLLPFSLHQSVHITASLGILLAFFYLIIIGTAVSFTLYLRGAQLIGGTKASILSCAEPLSSALLSVWLLGVVFTIPDWIGTLLILCSVIIIALDARRRQRAKNRAVRQARYTDNNPAS